MTTPATTVEHIVHEGRELAILVPAGFHGDGIEFFTAPEYSQQVAYMRRPRGHVIAPHVHNAVEREVHYTLETLVVRSGRVRLDLYTPQHAFATSRILNAGDIVLLVAGGHGLDVLDDAEIVEIKQGPYAGDRDKTRFEAAG